MQRHSTTSISPRTGSSMPYGKPGHPGRFGRMLPLLFGTFGAGLIVVAAVTALVPQLPAELDPLLEGLNRAGLDKGPLAMFGLLTLGVAFSMRRPRSIQGGTSALHEHWEREHQNIEASFQETHASMEALRQEVHAAHQFTGEGFEAAEAANAHREEAGKDRLYRLATSLDQLGALVSQRMEATRGELERLLSDSLEAHRSTIEGLLQSAVQAAQSPAAEPADLPMAPRPTEATRPIYTGSPTEAMASFMADLEALPQDLVDGPAELADLGLERPEGETDPAGQEPAAALPHPEASSPTPGLEDGLKLIDQMSQHPASSPPLFPEVREDEAS